MVNLWGKRGDAPHDEAKARGADEAFGMKWMHGTPEDTALRVKKLPHTWMVENARGESVGNAQDLEAAVRIAHLVAEAEQASVIQVLSEDGSVCRTIDV